WNLGAVWYDGYGYPQFCEVAYNFWVSGFDLQATQILVNPLDLVGIVGYIPANYGYLNVFSAASAYYQGSMFYGGSWGNNWASNYWSYWYSYGFSNNWNYSNYFTSNPSTTNTWDSSAAVYITVNGSQAYTFNGTNYLWTNNAGLTGPLG